MKPMADQKLPPPCIRCGRVPGEKDRHCTACGAPVQNRCCDEPGLFKKGCSHVNEPNAAFCARCGEPTLYQLHGLITPRHASANRPGFLKLI